MFLNRRLFVLIILILALAGTACAEADYVRLHVIASDDTEAAQALKLEVRDAVLEAARELLSDAKDADAAWAIVVSQRDTLEDAARNCVRKEGYDEAVCCETGVFPFPDRVYGDVLVPAGDYRALRVVIGEGQGKNWWCVLFPSLCDPDMLTDDAPPRSIIWDWLCGLFGGDAP